jgi:acyl-CoA thioester hydrolase
VAEPTFVVRVKVRHYELDTNGHLSGPVYLQYADHARWETLRAAGVSLDGLLSKGFGPINLETTVRFHNEVGDGDEIDIICTYLYGEGKTGRVEQRFCRPDGTVVAEVISVTGLLDLKSRRLVPDPGGYWREVAEAPELLGL